MPAAVPGSGRPSARPADQGPCWGQGRAAQGAAQGDRCSNTPSGSHTLIFFFFLFFFYRETLEN